MISHSVISPFAFLPFNDNFPLTQNKKQTCQEASWAAVGVTAGLTRRPPESGLTYCPTDSNQILILSDF